MDYAVPTLCNRLAEMKGSWQGLELPDLVKGSGDACEMHVAISYLTSA
jgi:hypothetical protein